MGYGLTCLAFWVVLVLKIPSAAAFISAWALLSAATWTFVRRHTRVVELSPLSAAQTRTLVLLLLLVPAVFLFPYKNLGAADSDGNRFYRAYFTADFVWHTALTAELTKYAMPPVNPYLGDRTIQYYWTYFLVPAVVAEEGPAGLRDIESVLKVNALCSGLLFMASLILAAWSASLSTVGTAIAVLIAVVAASAEGLYAVWDLTSDGRSLARLADTNIDAITAWEFSGLRVDSLVRSMWYNPQHSMSAALGLLVFPVGGAAGAAATTGAIVLAGTALALCTTFNPFIGGLFSLIYGAVIAIDAVRSTQFSAILRHATAAALVGAAMLWCISNDMVEGAAGVVLYGFGGYARNAPITTLVLSVGPLLIPALATLWPPWQLPLRLWPSVVGTALGLGVFYLIRLSVEGSYIGFRAGQLLQLTMGGLAAACFARMWQTGWRKVTIGLGAVLIAIGLPTTVIDTYNTQDISNRRMGPGFHWTVIVTAAEHEAYRWIRRQTPRDAIVQMDPQAHGRETWSQLPTFAWRRMAAARPISLMNIPDYDDRSRKVHELYATGDGPAAAAIARELGIDYVFVGPAEQKHTPRVGLAKFRDRKEFFELVFDNGAVRIYRVRTA